MASIGGPEPADRGLCGAGVVANMIAAAHLDDRGFFECTGDATLDEVSDSAIFHGDIAGGSDQIRLLEAHLGSLFVIVLETQDGPVQFGAT